MHGAKTEALSGRTAEQTEIVHGDILEPDSLRKALTGVTAALPKEVTNAPRCEPNRHFETPQPANEVEGKRAA